MAEIFDFVVIGLMLFTAFLSIKLKKTFHSVVSFLFMSVLIAVLFVMLQAPFAAVFQVLIYAGVIVILILVTLHTIKEW